MSSNIPPTNPTPPNQPEDEHIPAHAPGNNAFAAMFPGASPEEVKKFTNGFINFTIQQMKQDQDHLLEALKKMQQDQQDGG